MARATRAPKADDTDAKMESFSDDAFDLLRELDADDTTDDPDRCRRAGSSMVGRSDMVSGARAHPSRRRHCAGVAPSRIGGGGGHLVLVVALGVLLVVRNPDAEPTIDSTVPVPTTIPPTTTSTTTTPASTTSPPTTVSAEEAAWLEIPSWATSNGAANTYRSSQFTPRLTFTVAEGWGRLPGASELPTAMADGATGLEPEDLHRDGDLSARPAGARRCRVTIRAGRAHHEPSERRAPRHRRGRRGRPACHPARVRHRSCSPSTARRSASSYSPLTRTSTRPT